MTSAIVAERAQRTIYRVSRLPIRVAVEVIRLLRGPFSFACTRELGLKGNEQDIADGKDAEKELWERRKAAASCNDNSFLRHTGLGWSLTHNGLHLRDDGMTNHFVILHLRVGGEALRASPDLMYSSHDASEVLIVETKFSRQPILRNLWLNVWAQLWCYAQLQTASQAKRWTVIGEVRGEAWSSGYGRGRNRVEGNRVLFLRALVRRKTEDPCLRQVLSQAVRNLRWAFLTNHVRNVEVCPLSLLTERSVPLPLLGQSCPQISTDFSGQRY